MNGKLKNAEAFKAGSRPAPSVRQSDILELEKMVASLGDDGMNGGSNPRAPYDESGELPDFPGGIPGSGSNNG